MRRLSHLARRFLGSLRPGGPSPAERAWAHTHLLESERVAWGSMCGPDRRHSAAVARRVAHDLGAEADRAVLAAALLHDVGKIDSRLRTPGRVATTVVAMVLGRERVARWPGRPGRYLRHDVIGAKLLTRMGSDPVTVAWTREHHLPRGQWSIPARIADALSAADDD